MQTAKNLTEYKIQASRLFKQLNSAEPEVSLAAARRMQAFPGMSDLPAEEIVKYREQVQRKHVLMVIAIEAGFPNWNELQQHQTQGDGVFDVERMVEKTYGALNRWYRTYEEARESLEREGGYLFPYRNQYFVCEHGLIDAAGGDSTDPDWEKIGRDWVRPADREAFARLAERMAAVGTKGR